MHMHLMVPLQLSTMPEQKKMQEFFTVAGMDHFSRSINVDMGERAFRYFMENAPAAQNDRAEIRKLEPYCYGQFTEGKDSPNFGRSHVHWLTGNSIYGYGGLCRGNSRNAP